MNTETESPFQVALDQYQGPVDLLLYLVRKQELDVQSLDLNRIVEQYLEYIELLREIDINLVGDFLEVASLLIEAKVRAILPCDSDDDSEFNDTDPREGLVQRLLLFKEFRDVAVLLEEQATEWQTRHARVASDLPPRKIDPREQPVEEVELWDLVSSFGRILKNNAPAPLPTIVVDETPIHVYMGRIHERLAREGSLRFSDLFELDMHKSSMVGIFLAILELVRHHNVVTEQVGEHGDIQILPGENFDDRAKIESDMDYL